MNPQCKDCRFWERLSPEKGVCHRYPPTGDTETSIDFFPITREADWCGEFQVVHASYPQQNPFDHSKEPVPQGGGKWYDKSISGCGC